MIDRCDVLCLEYTLFRQEYVVFAFSTVYAFIREELIVY